MEEKISMYPNVIVLEGCDCAGKSTFAKMLSEKNGYEIVKGSSFEISELGADGMFEHMMSLLDRENIIIDRFFWSNLVYGKLFNYPMMSKQQYNKLKEKMERKALLIYIEAPVPLLKQRMKQRGDDMIKVDNIEDILAEYLRVRYIDYIPKSIMLLNHLDDFEQVTTLLAE